MKFLRNVLLVLTAALVLTGGAQAAGGDYVFDGGTARQQNEVRRALDASTFDWSIVPTQVTLHIRAVSTSYATPGHIWLDGDLLDSGRFSWAVVQHEFSHQVDFALFTPATRATLAQALGTKAWCYETADQGHGEQGCERFASVLSWAYWPSADNSYKPTSKRGESAAMAPAAFRKLLASLIGSPSSMRKPE